MCPRPPLRVRSRVVPLSPPTRSLYPRLLLFGYTRCDRTRRPSFSLTLSLFISRFVFPLLLRYGKTLQALSLCLLFYLTREWVRAPLRSRVFEPNTPCLPGSLLRGLDYATRPRTVNMPRVQIKRAAACTQLVQFLLTECSVCSRARAPAIYTYYNNFCRSAAV